MPRERILVVDDEEPIRQLMVEALEGVECDIDLASVGQEALDATARSEYGAVLLDLDLPDLPGEEILRHVKRSSPDTEVIIITGHATTSSAIEAVQLGVFDYIRKPFRVQSVIQTLRNALTKRRLALENRRLLADLRAQEIALQQRVRSATSALRQTNEDLVATSARMMAILESLADGVITVDEAGTITFLNQAAVQITGLSPETVQGKPWSALIDRDLAEKLAATLLTGQVFSGSEGTILRADGRLVPIRLTSSVFRSQDGEVLGAVQAFQDTSREQELERIRSEFLTTVSHELRTPLASVRGYVELLTETDDQVAPETQEEYLRAIRRNTDRLVELTQSILDMAKVEAGMLDVTPRPVDAARLVRRVAADYEPEMTAAGVQLIVETDPDELPLESDPRRLEQAVRELLENALKYAAEGKLIVLISEQRGADVLISVRDCGPGIPPEHQAFVFDKFYRVDGSLTRKTDGAGLGLALVRAITDRLGGRVELESRPGQGCAFTLRLPVRPPREAYAHV
jgi:PAS domain S-box-containing protein